MKNLSKESTKITTPAKPKTDKYLNLGYITNTATGTKLSGGFTAMANVSTSTRGWSYSFTSDKSSLTVNIPVNKAVKVFMIFNDGAEGQITVTDSKNQTRTINSSEAKIPTLVDVGNMEGKITLTPQLQKGGFTIHGIGIEK